jgi:hypothetical protein
MRARSVGIAYRSVTHHAKTVRGPLKFTPLVAAPVKYKAIRASSQPELRARISVIKHRREYAFLSRHRRGDADMRSWPRHRSIRRLLRCSAIDPAQTNGPPTILASQQRLPS